MAKEHYFKVIKYNDIFSAPDFQEKIKFYAGRKNGRFMMGVSEAVGHVIEVVGDTVLTGTTSDENLVLIPNAAPENKESRKFNPVFDPMLLPKFVPWRDPVVEEFLNKRLKLDGLWEFQGRWDVGLGWLVFPLKDGKEVEL